MSRISLVILFSFLRRTLYDFWISHYGQLQLPVAIFNKRFLANISVILDKTRFSTISLHHKSNLTRLSSPLNVCRSYLKSYRTSSDLGSYEIRKFQKNSLKSLDSMASTQTATQKPNFDVFLVKYPLTRQ